MWKAKKYPDVWQGWHQALEVQQALIFALDFSKSHSFGMALFLHFSGFRAALLSGPRRSPAKRVCRGAKAQHRRQGLPQDTELALAKSRLSQNGDPSPSDAASGCSRERLSLCLWFFPCLFLSEKNIFFFLCIHSLHGIYIYIRKVLQDFEKHGHGGIPCPCFRICMFVYATTRPLNTMARMDRSSLSSRTKLASLPVSRVPARPSMPMDWAGL